MKKVLLSIFAFLTCISSYAQYCTSTATSQIDEEIFNVTFGALNNSTGCGPSSFVGTACAGIGTSQQYSDFTVCGPLAPYLAGASYPFSVSANTCNGNYGCGVKIYIDFNQNFLFTDPGEMVYVGPNAVNGTLTPFIASGNITIPISALPGPTRMRVILWETGTFGNPTTLIQPCSNYTWGETEDYLINIIPPTPCSSPTSAGTLPDTIDVCPASSVLLTPQNTTLAANILYQWITSTNGGTTWTNVAGGTNPTLLVPAGTPPALYRFSVICTNTFDLDTTNAAFINVALPTPVTLPYTQDFEQWYNYCDSMDVPGYEWVNAPFTGNSSWRRNDQGGTGLWTTPGNGAYTPPASSNLRSARYHSYYSGISSGNLDLFLDLSGTAGTNTLFFDYINFGFSNSLAVEESSTGALGPFTALQTFTGSSTWTSQAIPINSTASNYVLRFRGNGSSFDDDFGIDNIMVVPPCDASVNAGFIPDSMVCANKDFTIKTFGSSLASGLTYDWQSAPSAGGPWSSIGTSPTPSFNVLGGIANPTFFRVEVTCAATGATSISNVSSYTMRSFYFCYCDAAPTSSFDDFDIGNFRLDADTTGSPNFGNLIDNVPLGVSDTFNNSAAINGYTQFWSLPLKVIYRDSTYRAGITSINQSNFTPYGSSVVFIDYNRNGVFDATELAVGGSIVSGGLAGQSTVTSSFVVPTSAQLGITGMRVITASTQPATNIGACGSNVFEGEVEDYLIEIGRPPCKAPTNPGVAFISDTLICPGYQVTLIDTGHTSLLAYAGLSTVWQESNNNINWTDIAGSNDQDTIQYLVNQQTYFRMRIICAGGDTAYSNVKIVYMLPAFGCYPASGSTGGKNDSCDIGYFTIGAYKFSSVGATGPHLGNPSAIRKRTEFINPADVITLYADSTYKGSVYSILRPYNHADGKVTIFIDYNNSLSYNATNERIFSGISGPTSFYLPFSFKTPINPVLNTITGMRAIINNNVAPNAASDAGVGLYTSGETEDYLVKFISKPNAVNELEASLISLDLYPNPTSGILYIDMDAKNLKDLSIQVYSITGAELYKQSYTNIDGQFNTTIDVSKLTKGIYTVKLVTDKGNLVRRIVVE
jgi:hypothetical protein